MEALLVLAVLVIAVLVIVAPLRADRGPAPSRPEAVDRSELEAAKEAKLGEIRDAELDWRTGKLSRSDWRSLDAELRAEAVELLRRLDELEQNGWDI